MSSLLTRDLDPYEVTTEVYSGPLDLLLDLIQKAELDITKLAIAQVTDQFLAYVQANQSASPEYISEFLVIASKLVQIKSESLLPRATPRAEDEDDPGEDLARQLRIYKQFKQMGQWLNARLENKMSTHLHVPRAYPVTTKLDLTGLDAQDLLLALEELFHRDERLPEGSLIGIPKMTLRHKVREIVEILRVDRSTSFGALMGEERSRLKAVVVFLALLELVKQDLVSTSQDAAFGDIIVTANPELFESSGDDLTIEY